MARLEFFEKILPVTNLAFIGIPIAALLLAAEYFLLIAILPPAFLSFALGYFLSDVGWGTATKCLALLFIAINIKDSLLFVVNQYNLNKSLCKDLEGSLHGIALKELPLSDFLEVLEVDEESSTGFRAALITSYKYYSKTGDGKERTRVFQMADDSSGKIASGHVHYDTPLGTSIILTSIGPGNITEGSRFAALHEIGHSDLNANTPGLLASSISPIFSFTIGVLLLFSPSTNAFVPFLFGAALSFCAYFFVLTFISRLRQEKSADIFAVAHAPMHALEAISRLIEKYPQFLNDRCLTPHENIRRKEYLQRAISYKKCNRDFYEQNFDKEMSEISFPVWAKFVTALFLFTQCWFFYTCGLEFSTISWRAIIALCAILSLFVLVISILTQSIENRIELLSRFELPSRMDL